ncbi:unnamed protein product [Mytilus coruscus]|uniref:Peptidase A2 domain-containing protein n=1 Tax=Mytilus coruscus TaxID=42192 RepID=A0A6J8EDQ3_MYTCO|nr:unnamed protein product [Mytilus coruscus]
MDAALDMIRWCQHTRKAVSAIQKPGKPANESSSEKPDNSPVVLGVGSTKSSMDNRLSRIEEHIEKMMSTVTSLVQEKSAKQGTSPSSRSPNQDNRSSNYSPRHERRVEFEEDNFVQDEVDKTSTGGASVGTLGSAHLFRCVVKIQNKEVNALIDTGSEVTILKDSVFDALTQKPYIIRETTMHGAGRDMRMTCRITNPTEFSIELLAFKETLHVAPIDCDMLIGQIS